MSVASPASPLHAGASRRAAPRRLLLLGNPNTGKTTLFNRLCGMRAKTANFPGTTTDLRVGRLQMPLAGGASETLEVVDLPGLYSLKLDLPESTVAANAVAGHAGARPAAAIVVADATNLSRHLMLVGELDARGGAVRRRPQHDRPRPPPWPLLRPREDVAGDRRAGRSDRRAERQGHRPTAGRPARGVRRARDSCVDGAARPGLRGGARAVGRDRRRRERWRYRCGGELERHAARPPRRDLHSSDRRSGHLPPRHGGALLGDLRRRQRPDGPDRGDLLEPGRLPRGPACRPARCATSWSAD